MSVHHFGGHSPVRQHGSRVDRPGIVHRPLTEPRSNALAFTPPVTLPYAPQPSKPARVHNAENSNSMRVVHKSNSIHTVINYPSPSGRSPIAPSPSPSFPPSLRPLPAVPYSAPPMGRSEFPQFPISPASPPSTRPLPPPPHPIPPQSNRPRPQRLQSLQNLKIDTNTPKVVEGPYSSDSPVSVVSSIEPPSPMTVKRKQHSKLRRHLGESIPAELIYGQKENAVVTIGTRHLDDVPEEISQDYTFWKVAPSPSEDSDSDSDSTVSGVGQYDRHLGKTLEMRWEPSRITPGLESGGKRHRTIGKWLREKDNRRWVATDYQDVLGALRRL